MTASLPSVAAPGATEPVHTRMSVIKIPFKETAELSLACKGVK